MKNISAYMMGLFYTAAGINHFVNPQFYEKTLSGLLPYPSALNMLSGAAEIVLGVGVMIPATRRMAAWGVVVLLVIIFPANVNMAIHWREWGASITPFLIRLPIQVLFLWWAYTLTKSK